MTDYIERKAALEIVKRTNGDYAAAWAEVNKFPAADAALVVHGRWIEDDYGYYHCDKCDWEFDEPQNSAYAYCPNCGAKMDGGKSSGY